MKKQLTAMVLLLAGMFLFTACSLSRSGRTAVQEDINVPAADAVNQEDGINQIEMDPEGTDPEGTDTKDTGTESTADNAPAEQADSENTPDTIYMVVKNDIQNYQITLMDLAADAEICYEYTDGTEFFDKYGNYVLSGEFSEGKLAVIERLNSNDTLGAIAFTDEAWDYEDVRKYSIDAGRNRIKIADTSYKYDMALRVFSDGEETNLQALGDSDTLNIYGVGRTIYSIVVESGHGTLALTNTKLFEGGWLNLGTKVYTTITPDMTMEIPEGIYEFSVANDGYGDSGEIRIRRDMTTTIDLNDYKGEGPKMCRLTFNVGVEGAVLKIDGKIIDASKPKKLRYGVYNLGVYAEGYDEWVKQLVINSPTAKIDILLSEETDASGTDSGENSTQDQAGASSGSSLDTASNNNTNLAGSRAGSLAGSRAGSLAGNSSASSDNSSSSGSSSSSGNKTSSALANAALRSSLASIITGGDSTDYLDTLSDLIKSLDRLDSASSGSED